MAWTPDAVRNISLTPPGMPSTDVLDLIQDGYYRVSRVKILLVLTSGYRDLCGILADYYESNEGIVTLAQGGTSGCNLCTFRKNTDPFQARSVNAYSNTSHSRNYSYMRTTWRYHDLDAARIPENQANYLGMKPTSSVPRSQTVLLRLEHRLRTEPFPYDYPHIPSPFKAFPCSIVAPDHCLHGIIKNIIAAPFVRFRIMLLGRR